MAQFSDFRENAVEFIKQHKVLVIVASVFLLSAIALVLLIATTRSAPKSGSDQTGSTIPTTLPTSFPVASVTPTSTSTPTPAVSADAVEVWGAFVSEETMAPVIDAFEAQYPGVKVVYKQQVSKRSEIDAYQAKVESSLNTTTGPDIVIVDSGWIGSLTSKITPAPDTIMSASNFKKSFLPHLVNEYIIKDEVYGVTTNADNLVLLYNKNLWSKASLDKPATTWQELNDTQLPAITAKLDSGQAAFAAGDSQNVEFWYETLNAMVYQKGIEINNNPDFVDLAASQQALDLYKQLGTTGKWSKENKLDIAEFLEGDLATYIAPSWRVNEIKYYIKQANLDVDLGVAALPQMTTESTDHADFGFSWGYVVNKRSEDTKLAWQFLDFLTQKETLQTLNQNLLRDEFQSLGMVFPRNDMTQSSNMKDAIPVIDDELKITKTWQPVDESAVRKLFAPLITGDKDFKDIKTELKAILAG
jgi:ABC-type glycerol-3-phosphate transport system substrate-binding protein